MRFRAPKGRNPPIGLAPQAPFRKFRGFLALVIVLGAVLESGASVLLVAPNPVANSCSLDSPPGIGDVPVQAPGPGRSKHRALAGAQGALSSKGPYLVLPNRDTTPATLMGHYLTWRPNLPYPACSSHCLI